MNESRHNQYIKTKSVKLPFKAKNSNISFCFSNIPCKQVVMIRQMQPAQQAFPWGWGAKKDKGTVFYTVSSIKTEFTPM